MFRKYEDGLYRCKKCGEKFRLRLQDVQAHEQIRCFGCGLPLLQKEPGSRDRFIVLNEPEMVKEEENNDSNKG